MRRLTAILVAGVVATWSAAYGRSMSCPAMRAQVLAHCCCPAVATGAPRLICCTVEDGSRVTTTPARERTVELQLAPLLVTGFSHPSDDFQVPPTATVRALLATAAGPPPVPLRI